MDVKMISRFRMSNVEQSEAEERCYALSEEIKEALKHEDYRKAYSAAMTLRNGGYTDNKIMIDDCIRICADQGYAEAMIYEVEHFGTKADGSVRDMAFPYLKALSELGYIDSFRMLGDCYLHGIGCEQDKKAAERCYFEAILFNCSSYAADKYLSFHPELKDYDGDNEVKKLIQSIVYDTKDVWKSAYVRLAELVMNGLFKEYNPATAYILLEGINVYDGISSYLQGECVLHGFGTEKDPVIAKILLEKAFEDIGYLLEWEGEEFETDSFKSPYYDREAYQKAFEETKRLLKEAEDQVRKMDIQEIADTHSGLTDEEQIYEAWRNKHTRFITRSKRKG